jgi:dolichol-phosphate mannosyltransferase
VPVYNESLVIAAFYARATAALSAIPGLTYELAFVDDGSTDDSYEQLVALAAQDTHVGVIRLSRNFGHQMAITAGLDLTSGDCVVVIDADLQDPPEVIAGMVEQWRQGFDVVYGVRAGRDGERGLKLVTASLFYRLLDRITGIAIPVDVGDFRLLSRRAADHVRRLREQDRFVRGLVSWVGFRQRGVSYHRDRRYAGVTKYRLRKMVKFAWDGVTSFSAFPLTLATWAGAVAAGLGLFTAGAVALLWLLGHALEGWALVLAALLLLGGAQLLGLGILGEYIGRIHLQTKGRPLYVVEDVRGLAGLTNADARGAPRKDADAAISALHGADDPP